MEALHPLDESEWVSAARAAKLLGKSRQWVARLARQKKIPAVRVVGVANEPLEREWRVSSEWVAQQQAQVSRRLAGLDDDGAERQERS